MPPSRLSLSAVINLDAGLSTRTTGTPGGLRGRDKGLLK